MGGAARADDKDAFLSERGEGAAHVEVVGGVAVGLDGELADRDVGVRVHEEEGDPGTMVEASLLVLTDGAEAGGLEEVADAAGDEGGPGGRVLEAVHGLGEAVEVVDGVVGAVDDVDLGGARVPVAGDDEDGAGPDAGQHLGAPGLEEVARLQRLIDGESGRAMGNEESVH